MSEDIFHSWKNQRFVVVENYLVEDLLDNSNFLVMLTDAGFWADNYDKLSDWCKLNGGHLQGMTVLFDTDDQLTMFTLRWS